MAAASKPESRSARAIWLAAAVAVVIFAADGAQAQALPERCREAAEQDETRLPLPYDPNASEEIVYLRVAGVRYAIPENYFRYPPIGCDTEEDAFALRVLLPTFEGWSEEKDAEFRGSSDKPYLGMSILLRITAGGMDRTFWAFANGADPHGEYPLWDGLLRTKLRRGDDVFFLREGGKVTFLMVCKTVEQVPYPGCAQHFRYRGATLQLTFRKPNLPDWQAIREGAIELLDAFVEAAKASK